MVFNASVNIKPDFLRVDIEEAISFYVVIVFKHIDGGAGQWSPFTILHFFFTRLLQFIRLSNFYPPSMLFRVIRVPTLIVFDYNSIAYKLAFSTDCPALFKLSLPVLTVCV